MKKLISFLYLSLVLTSVYSQNEYYDAISLKFKYNEELDQIILDKEVRQLLVRYYPGMSEDDIDSALLNHNPFFKNLFVPYALQGDETYFKSGLIASLGNLNVTNFADGLAKFLVERSKEELNVAFFRQFEQFLSDYPEIQVVFPTTYDFLKEILSYQYNAMLPALRAAFQKDLNAFTTNILNLRDKSKYPDYLRKPETDARIDEIVDFFDSKEGRSIAGALIIADGIVKGNNAADIISSIANDMLCLKHLDENLPNLLLLTDLISSSLRSNDEGRIWITRQQVNDLVKDEITLKIYLGLIYATDQKSKNQITFPSIGPEFSLQKILTDLSTAWNSAESMMFRSSFTSFANAMSQVADNTKTVLAAQEQGDQPSILVYADFASSIADLLTQSANFLLIKSGDNASFSSLPKEILKFTRVINNATDACYDIKSQNYAALVLHTSSILSELLESKYDKGFKEKFIKYGTFMANIVEAKNSDEVKAAIEAAVLPVGSSSIKRETDLNISLNAFIGPFGGLEYLPKLKEDQWAPSIGITAPVGVAVSWGNFGKDKIKCNKKVSGGKSLTIFVPVIDVGSMASFRMGNDSSEVASEVKLSNIISPGLYFYYGFGKCPISMGLGVQAGPQLREVTAEINNIDKNLYFRFGFNIVVDIPLFNLYTKN